MANPNHAKQQILEAWLSGATVKMGLLDNGTAYTFDGAAHEFVDDLDGTSDGDDPSFEPADGSYSRQTVDTSAGTFTQDDTDNEGVWDPADVTFPSLSTTNDIQAIFIYLQVGGDDTTPADDPNVIILDDDSAGSLTDLPIATNGSDLTVTFDAEGAWNIT